MIGVLIKKQFAEFLGNLAMRKTKKGEVTKKASMGIVGKVILLLICLLSLSMAFLGIATMMGDSLFSIGQETTYFVIMTDITLLLSIMGSAMTAYAMLFQAKDTEFLMSLPIKPSAILISRSLVVFILSLVYVMVSWVPTCGIYFTMGNPSFPSIITSALTGILISVFTGAISCILGGLIAVLMSKIKNKTFITVFVTLIFLGGIYYFDFNSAAILQKLAENAGAIREAHESSVLYFIVWAAEGSLGDLPSFLTFTALTAALLLAVIFVLSKNFRKLSVNKIDQRAKAFTGAEIKVSSPLSALMKKEFTHYTSSPAYILNSSLATFMMILASIVFIVMNEQIRTALSGEEIASIKPFMAVIVAGVAIFVASMNCITAPSISLEGNNIWILQTSGIDPMYIFLSKYILHMVLSAIPAALLIITFSIVIGLGVLDTIMIVLVTIAFVSLTAAFGLMMDVRSPKLDWVNETIPIKTNISVLFSMFGSWGLIAVMAGTYLLTMWLLPNALFLGIWVLLLLLLNYLCYCYLEKKGKTKFSFS